MLLGFLILWTILWGLIYVARFLIKPWNLLIFIEGSFFNLLLGLLNLFSHSILLFWIFWVDVYYLLLISCPLILCRWRKLSWRNCCIICLISPSIWLFLLPVVNDAGSCRLRGFWIYFTIFLDLVMRGLSQLLMRKIILRSSVWV